MTLAVIPTVAGLIALVPAILVGSTIWWPLVGLLLVTPSFNWSRVAREHRRFPRSRDN